jgi:hypothetical protein
LLKDFYNVTKPAIALRFLDFPTLILEGQLNQTTGRLRFGQGKKCNFKMNSEELAKALASKPFFVMFIDASSNNIQMLASSNVCLQTYASNSENPEFLQPERPNFNLRRNFIQLYDPMRSEVVRLDVSIGVSLMDRNE